MSEQRSLVDKLYKEGYHFYGSFFGGKELARGLLEVALDLASNRLDGVKLLTLGRSVR
ncbi:MAG: hypothetical protein AABX65_04105 [Nanoarchaeota archaeon]